MTGTRQTECPQCGQYVARTHTCHASPRITPPVPKPSDFADQVARARAAARARQDALPLDVEADQ